jgi:hypothetical protein
VFLFDGFEILTRQEMKDFLRCLGNRQNGGGEEEEEKEKEMNSGH